MDNYEHTVLCVDDEKNILNALKRLLRGENYRLITALSGTEGLKVLEKHAVHVVITDQRMPEMTGTEFLARVKEGYPDVIRIVLTGYTEVDSITESINKGHIYKFFLKPWNDQNIKLEIRQALEQYDLIEANKRLHQTVVEQNEELRTVNENLERLVEERTEDLKIQNQVLELSRTILEDLPLPVIGVSAERIIVLVNREAQSMVGKSEGKKLSESFSNFSSDLNEKLSAAIDGRIPQKVGGYQFSGVTYDIDFIPLSRRFSGKGAIITLRQVEI
jgi:response regulator RpfG family c-di-GMP phosphodiesterase